MGYCLKSLFPLFDRVTDNHFLSEIHVLQSPFVLWVNFLSSLFLSLQTESELVEAVDRDLRKMLINPNTTDPLVLGVRVWPQAIPQFLIGHFDILDAARDALKAKGLQGLFLGGNYVSGVALGRCVEGAYEVAAEVTDFLSQYANK